MKAVILAGGFGARISEETHLKLKVLPDTLRPRSFGWAVNWAPAECFPTILAPLPFITG